jgi:hypothetical protein
MLFDLANGIRNLIHIAARPEQLSLCQPDSLCAEPIVRRTLVPLHPGIEEFLSIDLLVSA